MQFFFSYTSQFSVLNQQLHKQIMILFTNKTQVRRQERSRSTGEPAASGHHPPDQLGNIGGHREGVAD